MVFPDDARFKNVLQGLADECRLGAVSPVQPLPCDRWIARSVLQKAIRRCEPLLAQRAVANLFEYDRRATWRALTIIALEDVGVGNIDVLTRIVAAQSDRVWRSAVGGDWAVIAGLVWQMAQNDHCQGACDLLLRCTNDPSLQPLRSKALDAEMGELTTWLADSHRPVIERGVFALAAGGGLADGQEYHDPAGVFDILSEACSFPDVVASCRAAWKISRNPMSMLLPLVWQRWLDFDQVGTIGDDSLPSVQLTSGIPGYALDQFTRRGNAISRTMLSQTPELRHLFDVAGVRSSDRTSTVGDLIFLVEVGRVNRRLTWSLGDDLRLPHRHLPAVARLGSYLRECIGVIAARGRQITILREEHLNILTT